MSRHTQRHQPFPWRTGNEVELHLDGDQFFPAMLTAIRQARHSILLEMYLVASGRLVDQFIEQLLAAAQRGIHVYLLFDDFGSRGLKPGDRQRLSHANIQLSFYNPMHYKHWPRMLFRDHRKLLLVDQGVAFVGGAGLTDDFAPQFSDEYWRDLMLELRGPCLRDWYQVFFDHWPGPAAPPGQPGSPRPAAEPGLKGRVCISQMSAQQGIKRSLLKQLKAARERIWITTPYFIPSWKIRRALRRAARRGVDVRLLLAGPQTDHPAVRHAGRRFYYSLLKHGVRIFEYQTRFSHSKAYLCDQWSSIGSANLDRWNMTWNLDANQEIDDPGFSLQLQQLFQNDLDACEEIDCQQWQQRPRYQRLIEWFWGKVDVLIHHITTHWLRRR